MEILGIGPSELIFIIVIALIVLGPKDMQKAGKSIGRYLNALVKSDAWKAFQQTSREIRDLPTNLMREANMDLAETEKEIRKAIKMQPHEAENSILPPSATDTEPDITIETPSDTPDNKVSPPNQNA